MHLLRFGNKLNKEVCDGFIFANLFNSLYLLVRLWWNILVANLATNFQDLVAKVKKLVTLAPVLGAISRPGLDTKTLTMALNSNFESRVSISCLCTCLWQFCFLLCLPPQHSPEQSRLKKKKDMSVMDYFSQEILIHCHGCQEILLSYWFAVSRQDNLLAWHKLFANLHELNSLI